tara:strand:+ start:339 stop:812 length:474 start_codon:yes stop_codon:yes gene_type:complete
MPNYQNGKIYKITCEETKLIYYGSTVQTLKKRLSQHKEHKDKKKYTTNQMTKPEIYLVEDFPCDTKRKLETRERYYIQNNDCINRIVPTRTQTEYYQDNKELRKQQSKEYKDKHKEELTLKGNIKINCECGGKYTNFNKYTHSKTKKHIKYINRVLN